ncbi:NACHT domain-containing protein [Kordia antarctica]|nr:hypothetical protein [Kordia antarctica]
MSKYIGLFVKYFIKKYRSKLIAKDLHPFYSSVEVQIATKYYIPTNFQNVPPSEDEEPGRSYIAAARNPLIPLFVNKAFIEEKDDNKYYLVLADSGMGKTTFMINLYLSYKFKTKWFWEKPKHNIKLLPFGHPKTIERIKEMSSEEKENCILLLDAFDEDNEAVYNYKKRLKEVLELIGEYRQVVITCRTQFFPSSKDEPTETGKFKFGPNGGQYNFQKIYLSVFDEKDIKRYLKKRFRYFFSFKKSKYLKAYSIVLKSPNLMMRPMLLSRITDLIDTDVEMKYGFQIYETLIDQWLERESTKAGIQKKYGKEYKKLLLNFSKALARYLYLNKHKRNSKPTLKVNEIIDNPNGLQLKDIEGNHIKIDKYDQGTRSLLNRNAIGEYKFSHKSILEYFLAYEVIHNVDFRAKFFFSSDLDAAKKFFLEMTKFDPELIKDRSSFEKLGLSNYEMNNFSLKNDVQQSLQERRLILFEISAKQFLTFTAFFICFIAVTVPILTCLKMEIFNNDDNKRMILSILLSIWIIVLIWKAIVFLRLRNKIINEDNKN